MYDFGERGIDDFGHTHKKIIPASRKLIRKTKYGPRLKKLERKLDVQGYDIPRQDIKCLKLKNEKIIRVGSDDVDANIKEFRRSILPYLNKAFTKEELAGMELYIEYPSKRLIAKKKFGGVSSEWLSDKKKKFSIIELAHKKDGLTAVHEMLHAVKYKDGRVIKNVHLDEAETDLESMMRLSPKDVKKIDCDDGYYDFVKGNKCKARREDVETIKKNCDLRDKEGLTSCIKKNIKKTHIGKIKIPRKYRMH